MSEVPRTPSPDRKAGQNADEEELQLTDEERMLLEIDQQKAMMIGALPDDIDDFSDDMLLNWAPHEKKLGQLEFQYQLFVERKRVARELAKFEEMYGGPYSEPCLMCLENIHVRASTNLIQLFGCCGGFICKACGRDLASGPINKCPLCRNPLTADDISERTQVFALAERGVSWAQTNVGKRMIRGTAGFNKQETVGLKWIKKAAAQNDPSALHYLSLLHRDGFASVLDMSQEEANELLMKSANLGYATANASLARFYFTGQHGFEEDPGEAIFRATVAYALDASNDLAAMTLGFYLKPEQATEPSPYLDCYYLNIAANKETDGMACCLYSEALVDLSKHLYNSRDKIPGFNVAPAAFFWLRKSRDMGYNDARMMMKEWESVGQRYCHNCSKEVKTGEKFKQCSKCKAQWYCSKECQVEAWKAGHKKDCKRAAILKFEDYLNAD